MLTSAQLATLKADILADPALAALPMNADGHLAIAASYNQVSAPDFWVWRTFVPDAEIYEVQTPAPDNSVWSWSIYIARSQAEREAWRQMVSQRGGVNPSLANVRAGIADIFSGAGGTAQRAHLLAIGRRLASRIERLLASGTGTMASPALMGLSGSVTFRDIETARES